MKEYKVIVIAVGGKNKLYESGTRVTQDNFETSIEQLEKEGYLVAVDEPENDVDNVADEPENDVAETRIPKFLKADGTPVFDIDDCNMDDLRTELKRREVEFKSNANKATLFGLI
jgi:hypothetical protein